MQKRDATIILSASDISNRIACDHLTALDLGVLLGTHKKPVKFEDPILELKQQQGQEHEAHILSRYRERGDRVADLTHSPTQEATLAAMKDGYDIIYQPYLTQGNFRGYADFLCKTERRSSALGNFSYEVIDTKLTQNTRAGTLLQLSLYSEMIAALQQTVPEFMHVLTPVDGLEPGRYRVEDYIAYYRTVKGTLQAEALEAQKNEKSYSPSSYPFPKEHCSICKWRRTCETQLREDDHLSFVAGIQKNYISALEDQNIKTLTSFAQTPASNLEKPQQGSYETLKRYHTQACVQHEGRTKQQNIVKPRPLEADRGFALLPLPNPGDIFFDIEGAKHFADRTLDYLFGWVTAETSGKPTYQCLWAHSEAEERRIFEQFIDMLFEHRQRFPQFFIYHYAPYEPAAFKRLMLKYGTREEEVDILLREGRFVDLARVTRQGLILSVESYSIKKLEQFYNFARKAELSSVTQHKISLELAIELRQSRRTDAATIEIVRQYNEDDCYSTLALRDWLETHRPTEIPRRMLRDSSLSEKAHAARCKVEEIVEKLKEGLPEESGDFSYEDEATLLIAQLLGFYSRERKAAYWERFRLQSLAEPALIEERAALAILTHVLRIEPTGRSKTPVDVYSYPAQECEIGDRPGAYAFNGTEYIRIGTVESHDTQKQQIKIKKSKEALNFHPHSLFVWKDPLPTKHQEEALLNLARFVLTHGISSPSEEFSCERQLILLGCAERHGKKLPFATFDLPQGEIDFAEEIVAVLNNSKRTVVPVQGPPGAGKTYNASRVITSLIKQGLKIGVTSLSHRAILNVLNSVSTELTKAELDVPVIHKGDPEKHATEGVTVVRKKNETLAAEIQAASEGVFGATSFFWARDDIADALDILFVDEAAQFSLAGTLATARAATKLVLLGDPQQLQQPIQVEHPGNSGESSLGHIIGESGTIPSHLGFFLNKTWRLAPAINDFTSELFYGGRLEHEATTKHQRITGDGLFSGSGYVRIALNHTGNKSKAPEEVEVISRIVNYLLDPAHKHSYIDRKKQEHPLTTKDILIVAPFNMQVNALKEALPNCRIGTVDKFQGQEAPIVIYSLASSSPEDAPRGMNFLYALDRLNVATSRAQALCIMVAASALFTPDCKTPEQMRLANAFCRYRELAREVAASSIPR